MDASIIERALALTIDDMGSTTPSPTSTTTNLSSCGICHVYKANGDFRSFEGYVKVSRKLFNEVLDDSQRDRVMQEVSKAWSKLREHVKSGFGKNRPLLPKTVRWYFKGESLERFVFSTGETFGEDERAHVLSILEWYRSVVSQTIKREWSNGGGGGGGSSSTVR